MKSKYLLIFHIWIACYYFAYPDITKTVVAEIAESEMQNKIEELQKKCLREEVDRFRRYHNFVPSYTIILHQMLPL